MFLLLHKLCNFKLYNINSLSRRWQHREIGKTFISIRLGPKYGWHNASAELCLEWCHTSMLVRLWSSMFRRVYQPVKDCSIDCNFPSRWLGRAWLCNGNIDADWTLLGVERSKQVDQWVHARRWKFEPASYCNVTSSHILLGLDCFGNASWILFVRHNVQLFCRYVLHLHRALVSW